MSRFAITSRLLKYENPWMRVHELGISRDGRPGIYGTVERHDAAIVIVSDEDSRSLLLKQFRFPIEGLSWEVPMGGIDPGESPETAARRELREETGIIAARLDPVGSFHASPGLTAQRAFVFHCRAAASDIRAAISSAPDEDEILDRKLFSASEINALVVRGELTDGLTLAAFALLHGMPG